MAGSPRAVRRELELVPSEPAEKRPEPGGDRCDSPAKRVCPPSAGSPRRAIRPLQLAPAPPPRPPGRAILPLKLEPSTGRPPWHAPRMGPAPEAPLPFPPGLEGLGAPAWAEDLDKSSIVADLPPCARFGLHMLGTARAMPTSDVLFTLVVLVGHHAGVQRMNQALGLLMGARERSFDPLDLRGRQDWRGRVLSLLAPIRTWMQNRGAVPPPPNFYHATACARIQTDRKLLLHVDAEDPLKKRAVSMCPFALFSAQPLPDIEEAHRLAAGAVFPAEAPRAELLSYRGQTGPAAVLRGVIETGTEVRQRVAREAQWPDLQERAKNTSDTGWVCAAAARVQDGPGEAGAFSWFDPVDLQSGPVSHPVSIWNRERKDRARVQRSPYKPRQEPSGAPTPQ